MADYTDKLYKDAVSSQQTQAAMPGAGPNSVTYVDNGERKTGTVDPDYWARMEGYYDQQYNDQVAANNKALEDARARAQEANQAQIDALRQQYQGTNRQLYRDYMQNVKTLPQQMSALGYSGGLSESGRLRLTTSGPDWGRRPGIIRRWLSSSMRRRQQRTAPTVRPSSRGSATCRRCRRHGGRI